MLRKKVLTHIAGTVRPRLSKKTAVVASSARSLSSSQAACASSSPSPNDVFATGTNAYYAEEMYRRWCTDSSSVHASWDAYFSGLEKGIPSSQAFQPPPGLIDVPTAADGAPALHVGTGGKELADHLKVQVFCFPRPSSSTYLLLAAYDELAISPHPQPDRHNFSCARTRCAVIMWPILTP